MGMFDISSVVMGVFRYSKDSSIPADTKAIQKVFFKLAKMYPEFFSNCLFDEEGFSQELENIVDTLSLDGMIGISGNKFETLLIGENFKQNFDMKVNPLFSKHQITRLMKMGYEFPKLMRNNESIRYKRLTKVK